MEEIWKPIPGYPGYEVSNLGQVKSYKQYPQGRLLRPTNQKGYLHLGIKNENGAFNTCVHNLVALAFLGPKPEGLFVCHNDGNPANNHPSNLRYDTQEENIEDVVFQRLMVRWGWKETVS